MGKIKKNDNLIIKDLMSSYKSRDLGYKIIKVDLLNLNILRLSFFSKKRNLQIIF